MLFCVSGGESVGIEPGVGEVEFYEEAGERGKLSRERGIDLRFEFACAEVGGGMRSFFAASGRAETPWSAESAIHTLARPIW